jgi:uncharacterized protein (DUF885 family)
MARRRTPQSARSYSSRVRIPGLFLFIAATALAQDDTARLDRLFAADWAWQMNEFPERASMSGYPGGNDRWTDLSLAAIERRKQHPKDNLKILTGIDRAKLTAAERLNYDLFRRQTVEQIEGQQFPSELLRVDPLFEGVHRQIPYLLERGPHGTVRDYDDMLKRLDAAPALIDQTIALLRKGMEAGVTPPKIIMRDVPGQIDTILTADLSRNALMQPFQNFRSNIPIADRERLRREAAAKVDGPVSASYRKLREFLATEYIPHCSDTIARAALPNGKAWYEYDVRRMTTTGLTARQIHDIGQSEVKRIRGEMDQTIRKAGFTGDFAAFVEYLRTDPKFYYTRAEDLVTGYRDICKRIDPELPRLFGKLPRAPYGVAPVPDHVAPSETTARYQGGPLDGSRPGNFMVNTYKMDSRPKFEMEALSLHESVPGHHLQIALAHELEDVPQFRKQMQFTAFTEGWGLYAESLGEELGFYRDPYSKFGQLSYEMWRACRLVVDTGMHALGWSRQQAIDFMKANSALTEQNITVEVDRYIAWPGQADAYKLGELKIKELRARAEKELGARFDIRAFHDMALGSGAIPLDVLEANANAWIADAQKAK